MLSCVKPLPVVARLLVAVAVAFSVVRPAEAIEVRASVDRDRLAPGDSAVLTVEVDGAQNAPAPAFDVQDGLRVRYLGPSTQISIVNGQMSAIVSHRYRVEALRTGSFSIGPFRVELPQGTFTAPPLQLVVSEAAAPSRPRADVRLEMHVDRTRPFVGERVPIAVRLYVGGVRLEEVHFPELSGREFVVEPFGQPARSVEVVGGKRYSVLEFRSELTPLRVGPIHVGPTTLRYTRLLPGRGGFFDPFFGGERRQESVVAPAIDLEVRPLPKEGRPAGFRGAVGRFEVEAEVSPEQVREGDPVTLRVVVRGRGNLAAVQAPVLDLGDDFRAYDPVESQPANAEDAKQFEIVLIPLRAGIEAVPAITFHYFDPIREQYRTIRRGPFPIQVQAAAVARPTAVAAASPRAAPAAQESKDIVYIKDDPGDLRPIRSRAVWARMFAAHLLPVALTGLLGLWVRRRERRANDPRWARLRAARNELRQALRRASKGGGSPDALAAAVRGYLGARLDLPLGAVERAEVLRRLEARGCGATTRAAVAEVLEVLDGGRYRPDGSATDDERRIAALAATVYRDLERWRLPRVLALLLVPAALIGPAEAGALQPRTAFFHANAAYEEGRYEDARALYERLIADGWASGELYYNLGNACFRAHQLGCAILNYERARRRLPRDPDVGANLDLAREKAGVAPPPDPLWPRLLFPTAAVLDLREATVAALGAWWAAWAAVAVGVVLSGARRAARVTALAAAVCWAVLASGAAYRSLFIEAPAAVVVASGRTAVRFEPRTAGREHFRVREGEFLWLEERRNGWWKIRRADGQRGWIPAAAVEPIDPAAGEEPGGAN